MGRDYRTGHNGAMRRSSAILAFWLLASAAPAALAWNAAGHRIVAAIAWRQLPPAGQATAADILAGHPHYPRWIAKADGVAYQAFLEASTWADDIRRDPRYYDDGEETPTPPLPGLADTARHKDWHYVDSDAGGNLRAGQLDRRLEQLAALLRNPRSSAAARTHALPWLIHLVGDAHQPLHVGSHDDDGGNRVDIENPFNPRLPRTNLHTWWDDLPGPPWLRGKRLEQVVDALLADYPPPAAGPVATWIRESRSLGRDKAYPPAADGEVAVISESFRDQSRIIANRRLVAAGYRLGWLLAEVLAAVPRETH